MMKRNLEPGNETMATKNQFIYTAITGSDWTTGAYVGAENDGWRDRGSRTEAEGYHDAVVAGDLGTDLIAELDECSGEFDAVEVANMLDSCKYSINESGNIDIILGSIPKD